MFGHVLAATVTGRNRQQDNSENWELRTGEQAEQLLPCFVFRFVCCFISSFGSWQLQPVCCLRRIVSLSKFASCSLLTRLDMPCLPCIQSAISTHWLAVLMQCGTPVACTFLFPLSIYGIYQESILVSCTNFSQLQTSMGNLHITFGSVHSFTPEIRMIKHTANWTIGKVLPDTTVDILMPLICRQRLDEPKKSPISVDLRLLWLIFCHLCKRFDFPFAFTWQSQRDIYVCMYIYLCVQNMSAVNIH